MLDLGQAQRLQDRRNVDTEPAAQSILEPVPAADRQGGFQLVDGFVSDLPAAGYLASRPAADRGMLRARVRLSPRGRRLAALLGQPAGVRIRRQSRPATGREDWVEAWVRADSAAAAVVELLALGAEVEVIHPPELRARLYETARQIAALHSGDGTSGTPG